MSKKEMDDYLSNNLINIIEYEKCLDKELLLDVQKTAKLYKLLKTLILVGHLKKNI